MHFYLFFFCCKFLIFFFYIPQKILCPIKHFLVAFSIINRETGEKYEFEKPLVKGIIIRRAGENEHRPIVEMDVKMGGEKFKANFTIAEREKFDYQMLVGRNILSGRAIVDVSISNTLK